MIGTSPGAIGTAVAQQHLRSLLGLDTPRGALVVEVLPGSPAAVAGLKPMDVVLSINGQAVNQASDLPVIISHLAAGTRASLRVWRERAEIEVQVDVAGQPVCLAEVLTAVAGPALFD